MSKIASLLCSLFVCACAYFGLDLPNNWMTVVVLIPLFLFFYFGCRGKIFA